MKNKALEDRFRAEGIPINLDASLAAYFLPENGAMYFGEGVPALSHENLISWMHRVEDCPEAKACFNESLRVHGLKTRFV